MIGQHLAHVAHNLLIVAVICLPLLSIAAASNSTATVLPEVSLPTTTDSLPSQAENASIATEHPEVNSSHSTAETHTPHHLSTESDHHPPSDTTKTVFHGEPYSWWKIVVTLVVFCLMAGGIIWILQMTENSRCKKNGGKLDDDQCAIEEDSDSNNEKILTSRV